MEEISDLHVQFSGSKTLAIKMIINRIHRIFAKSFQASNPIGSQHLTEHSVPLVEFPFDFFSYPTIAGCFQNAVAIFGTGAGNNHLGWSRRPAARRGSRGLKMIIFSHATHQKRNPLINQSPVPERMDMMLCFRCI
jgi:hypothetical protein